MIVKKDRLRASLPLLALFCILLYTPFPRILPIAYTKAAITIVSALILVLNRRMLIRYVTKEWKIILFSCVVAALSVLVPTVFGTSDYSYLPKSTYFFRQILVYLLMIQCIERKHGKQKLFEYFVYYFSLVHAVHVIGTILLVLIPNLGSLWFSVFSKLSNTEERLKSYGYTFRIGWQGYAGFRLTMRCALSLIFSLFLFLDKNRKTISAQQFIIIFFLNYIGCMFYGRSGLIAGTIVSLLCLVRYIYKKPKLLLGIAAFITTISLTLNVIKDLPAFHDWYIWMSTPIINLVTTGDMQNTSYNELKQMNAIEIEPKTMLIGDGKFMDNGHYYRSTDAGFIRSILYWGLVGSIPVYLVVFLQMSKTSKFSLLLFIQLLIVFLIFEYKGDVYYEFIPLISSILFSAKARREHQW